ncbi:MAG: hypothetical protein U0168_07425 [Nannocystaceae bacterium]
MKGTDDVDRLFLEAWLERLRRARQLARRRAQQPALVAEVEALLHADADADGSSAGDVGLGDAPCTWPAAPGSTASSA